MCRKNPFDYNMVGCFDEIRDTFDSNKNNILIVGVTIVVIMVTFERLHNFYLRLIFSPFCSSSTCCLRLRCAPWPTKKRRKKVPKTITTIYYLTIRH